MLRLAPLLISVLTVAAAAQEPDDPAAVLEELGARLVAGELTEAADLQRLITVAATHAQGLSGDERAQVLVLAHDAALSLGNPQALASTGYNAGLALREAGRLGEARALLEDALQRAPDAHYAPFLRVDLASLARARGDWGAALVLAREVRAGVDPTAPFLASVLYQATGEEAAALAGLGLVDRAALVLDELALLERELAGLTPEDWLAGRLFRLDLWNAAEDWERVEGEVTAALADATLAQVRGDGAALLLYRRARARAAQALERPALAGRAAEDLRGVLERGALPPSEAPRAWVELAQVVGLEGDLDAAVQALDAADGGVVDLAAFGAEVPPGDRALLAAVRARLLLAGAPVGVDAALVLAEFRRVWDAVLAEWRATPMRPGGVGFLHYYGRRAALSELIRLEVHADEGGRGVERAFEHLLAAQALGTLARRLGAPAADADRVRADLLAGPDHGLLAYLPAADRTHVFALDAQGLAHAEVAPDFELEDLRDQLGPLVARRLSARERGRLADAVAAATGALVPARWGARVAGWSRLTISGTGHLGAFPFEALELTPGRTLGESHAIDRLPSLPLGLALAARAAGAPVAPPEEGGWLVLFAPAHGAGARDAWPELEELALGADHLGPLAGGVADRLLDGADASPTALAAALADGAPAALCLLAHGAHDWTRERPAGVVLAPGAAGDDGVLWCGGAEALEAPPPLVVLAACGAARGPLRRGDDGAHHLGGAFLYAGARCVLVAHSDLHLGATLRLVGLFREELERGAAPAEALRRARVDLADSGPYGDPWFHASVQVLGLGQAPLHPLVEEPALPLALLVAAMLAAALIPLVLSLRRVRRAR